MILLPTALVHDFLEALFRQLSLYICFAYAER